MTSMTSPEKATPMAWTIQPIKRHPVKGALVAAFCLVMWGGVWVLTKSPLFLALAFLFLGGSVAPFYLPVRFQLTAEGVTKEYLGLSSFRPWSYFRSYYYDRAGILLSPFATRSLLESYRGLFVRFEMNGEEILAYVRKQMDQNQA